ncbi:response regulator [Geomicrobium sp. JCM 19038]|uniref:response regulator n=1 Tax=Geomicrobium sp. JCM 19038 TaxID=1460635 RepID=UPI00045F473F|nr:response regulator [Geomicrobium sp. JCM 19038]GAK07760.1 two-component response regulator [Geomicrobium sp. JCM 19038]
MYSIGAIDDEPLIIKFHELYTEKVDGYVWKGSANTLSSGKEMILNKKLDLLLLDIYLDQENGLQLLQFIRNENIDLDVILITSANDMESITLGKRYGAIDFLVKPFTFERFKEALERYQSFQKLAKPLNQQTEIDQLFHDQRLEGHLPRDLPKGITKETAIRVLHAFNDCTSWLTTAQLSEQTQISHVSLRKYLRFFSETGLLSKEVMYQASGRPLQQYQLTSKGEEIKQNGFI